MISYWQEYNFQNSLLAHTITYYKNKIYRYINKILNLRKLHVQHVKINITLQYVLK